MVSRNTSKAGGLDFNPLLGRTDTTREPSSATSGENTRTPVNTSTRTHVTGTDEALAVKFTFYFMPDQLDRLDTAWSSFRRQARGSGHRLSKSLFVRVALDRLLDDFDQNPEAVLAMLRDQSFSE